MFLSQIESPFAAIILYLFFSYKSLRNAEGFYFIALLAAADLFATLGPIPLHLYECIQLVEPGYPVGGVLCHTMLMLTTASLLNSQFANIALCLDRSIR